MALANPTPSIPSMVQQSSSTLSTTFSAPDHHQSCMAGLLLAAEAGTRPSDPFGPNLLFGSPHQLLMPSSPLWPSLPLRLDQLKLEAVAEAGGEELSSPPATAVVAQHNLANNPIAPFQQQNAVERALLELLLTRQRNNALCLLGQAALLGAGPAGLVVSMPPTFQPTFSAAVPANWTASGAAPAPLEGGHPPNGVPSSQHHNGADIQMQMLDQLESLSRNKLGRSYNPGRPLGMLDRQKILELYQKGLKISHIAKVIGVTHSCVSKIMTRYRRTGSIHPRSAQLPSLHAGGRRQQLESPTAVTASNESVMRRPSSSTFLDWQNNNNCSLKCSSPSAFHRISSLSNSGEQKSVLLIPTPSSGIEEAMYEQKGRNSVERL